MNNKIYIKEAVPSDARGIMDVRYQTWKSTYPVVYPKVTEADIERKFANFENMVAHIKEGVAKNSPEKKFLIAKERDKIIGFIIASKVAREPREIKALYVLKDHQGKGAGKELMKQALDWLEAKNSEIMLEVVSTNNPAIKFYKGFGFEKTRDLPTPSKEEAPDGIPIPHIEMVRKPVSI